MLILLAPAKRQNIGKEILPDRFSQPAFLKEANDLIGQLRKYAQSELSKILHINPKLAEINLERLHQWQMPLTRNSPTFNNTSYSFPACMVY